MALHEARDLDGRFATAHAPRVPLVRALALYEVVLAAVCRRQGLAPIEVKRQLARRGEATVDPAWRAACYARQLAMYLLSTEYLVRQKHVAQIAGVGPGAVCHALRAIEALRDEDGYEALIAAVLRDAREEFDRR